jgi:glycosyltransferase involved in cell wall biosynthesis
LSFLPPTAPRAAVILPAYNEASRITGVLRAVAQAGGIHEVLVVTDGCTDDTAAVARAFAADTTAGQTPVLVFELEHNIGKGGAMTYGAHRTDAEVLVFLDADLSGLQAAQVEAMLEPLRRPDPEARADMVLGLFGNSGGKGLWGRLFGWWLGLCHRQAAFITGQRAIRREVFLAVPDLTRSRFGVETAITRYVSCIWKLRVEHVSLPGVSHPIKEQKNGLCKGLRHRLNMYGEIATYLALDTARHYALARYPRQAERLRQWIGGDK